MAARTPPTEPSPAAARGRTAAGGRVGARPSATDATTGVCATATRRPCRADARRGCAAATASLRGGRALRCRGADPGHTDNRARGATAAGAPRRRATRPVSAAGTGWATGPAACDSGGTSCVRRGCHGAYSRRGPTRGARRSRCASSGATVPTCRCGAFWTALARCGGVRPRTRSSRSGSGKAALLHNGANVGADPETATLTERCVGTGSVAVGGGAALRSCCGRSGRGARCAACLATSRATGPTGHSRCPSGWCSGGSASGASATGTRLCCRRAPSPAATSAGAATTTHATAPSSEGGAPRRAGSCPRRRATPSAPRGSDTGPAAATGAAT